MDGRCSHGPFRLKISDTPSISKCQNSRNLPQRWTTLYELSKLTDTDFKDAQRKGLITRDTSYKAAGAIPGELAPPFLTERTPCNSSSICIDPAPLLQRARRSSAFRCMA